MGSASISQILTSSFVPLLARVQDEPETFRRYVCKINRFTAFILFPAMLGLALAGTPLFHTLFAEKWDGAILLFQILTVRGIFVVLASLYSNYLLALGYAKRLFTIEVVKDLMILAAILATVWSGSLPILVWGQLGASALTYVAALIIVCRATGYKAGRMIADLLPSLLITLIACVVAAIPLIPGIIPDFNSIRLSAALQLSGVLIIGAGAYIGICRIVGLPELKEATAYLLGRFRKKTTQQGDK